MDELTEKNSIRSKAMYDVYQYFADTLDMNVLGHKRILDQLREYDTLQILNMERTSEGFGKGTPLKITLLDDSSLILQSIGLDTRCRDIPLDSQTKKRIIQRVEKG